MQFLYDTHAHLDDEMFANDRAEVIEKIKEMFDLDVDSRKLDLPDISLINTSYTAVLKLPQSVRATITIKVVEQSYGINNYISSYGFLSYSR